MKEPEEPPPHTLQQPRTTSFKRLQIFHQLLLHLQWTGAGSISGNWFAILVNNEFSEIPFDGINQSATLLLLQVFVQWMGIVTIHIDLLEHIELNLTLFDETLDLLIIAWLLIGKLVGWKTQYPEAWGLKNKRKIRKINYYGISFLISGCMQKTRTTEQFFSIQRLELEGRKSFIFNPLSH